MLKSELLGMMKVDDGGFGCVLGLCAWVSGGARWGLGLWGCTMKPEVF